ncbi:MAG: hypothetical protein OXI50_03715 [Gammaproteobacteria bacterium]|nr:hypothetical protein [Gammaproteobacteria bacterium]
MLTGKDLLLLLLYAPSDETADVAAPIAGRTRLAKLMFLFKREVWQKAGFDSIVPREKLPRFFPWRFGPFSKDVFNDVDFFRTIGFLEATSAGSDANATAPAEAFERAYWADADPDSASTSSSEPGLDEYEEETFALTSEGIQYIEDKHLWATLSGNQQSALIQFKRRLANAPLYAILKYVYSAYPNTISKSEIVWSVLR